MGIRPSYFTLKAGPHILNHFVSLVRALGKYPWDLMKKDTPLSSNVTDKLCNELGIAKWTAVFGLWGTELEVTALQSYIKQTLPNVGTLNIWDKKELINESNLSCKNKNDLLNLFKQMSGNVTGLGLARPYWRNKKDVPKNPAEVDLDKDRCGFLSINPCCPFTGEDALTIFRLSTEMILQHGFEPNITAYSTRPRILQFHITLCFDRDNHIEDQRALECQAQLTKILQEKGYYSFRLNIASMDQFNAANTHYLALLKSIKKSVDLNNILSPGRYDGQIEQT